VGANPAKSSRLDTTPIPVKNRCSDFRCLETVAASDERDVVLLDTIVSSIGSEFDAVCATSYGWTAAVAGSCAQGLLLR
jgi:hypothetical protein